MSQIVDVRCPFCGKSIVGNWVYRDGGPKMYCPECRRAFEWPYASGGTAECNLCHGEPAFISNISGPANLVFYCADCTAKMAVEGLKSSEKPTRVSTYLIGGWALIAAGAGIAGFGLYNVFQGENGTWCLFVLAFIVAVVGLDFVLRRGQLAADSAETAARVRTIRETLESTPMTTREKLAVFGMEPGGPMRSDWTSQALEHFKG